jgi:phosphatidylglycerol lysyltransferase
MSVSTATLLLLAGVSMPGCAGKEAPVPDVPEQTRVALSRGPSYVKIWRSQKPPRALVLFGSGDGGWSPVESRMCGILASSGCLVAGIDCRKLAATDYSHEGLAADWAAIVACLLPAGKPLPVIYGGWSMGAAQAVPAAASAPANSSIKGLLLLSAGSRGRFGLRLSDEAGVSPMGKGTFALADFNRQLARVRVAQLHGSGDLLDSTAWLDSLHAPHRLWNVPNGWHNFARAGEALPKTLKEAIDWLLESNER